MRQHHLILLLAIFFLILPQVHAQTQTSLDDARAFITDDAQTSANAPDTNENFPNDVEARTAGMGGIRNGYFMANMSNFSTQAVLNVTCMFYVGYNGGTATWTITNTTFEETTITYNNMPCDTSSCTESSLGTTTAANSRVIWNITSHYLADTDKVLTFRIRETAGDESHWGVHGDSTDSEKPFCNITYSQDTTPPEITLINLTSEGGEGQLINMTDKICQNAGCVVPQTTDTTPTFAVKTNESSSCSIGLTNANYTDLGLARNCSGAGSATHTCTIIPDDSLHEEETILYIGCKDALNNENLNSTSGAFKVYISPTDYEAWGRAAIDSAAGLILGTPSIYADQKLYARNSADNQFAGQFDRVVKYLNKIWAFNVLTGNDSAVGGFNITPTLYILEFRNSTPTYINNTVQQLINSTR